MSNTKLQSVAPADLAKVIGGASRVTSASGSNDQVTQLLSSLTTQLTAMQNNKSGAMDPMSMMMMMMMMGQQGGGGGGGAQVAQAAPPPEAPPAPQINISTSIGRG
ncbi:MAG TPA: hypothetical protein VGM88_23800 [Kofleriaceae bacterium]|jgi:hypothetical protein